jgi:ribosomal protein S8
MNTLEVFVPTASTRVDRHPLANRLKHVQGARIAWLDNMKANAAELLHDIASTLKSRGYEFDIIKLSKDATAAAPESVMAHLKTCDAVVLAIAD